jgi:hypothetical protein
MAVRDDEHARLAARSYQWLTASKRRRLAQLDARATVARYPWLTRLDTDRRARRDDATES